MANKTSLERTLETLVELVDLQRKSSERNFDKVFEAIGELSSNINRLELSISQLTTQQRQTSANLDKLSQNLDKISEVLSGHLALSRSQSENIAELTKLATMMIAKN